MVVFTGLPSQLRHGRAQWSRASSEHFKVGSTCSEHTKPCYGEALSVAHNVSRARVEDDVEVLMREHHLRQRPACGGVPMETEP